MSASSATRQLAPVSPQGEWSNILRAVAIESFSSTVGAKIVIPEDEEVRVLAEVTGMVGIAGQIRAIFSLRCSLQSATKMASQMLGVSLEEAVAQRNDAVGEMSNIIAGYFKSKIGLGEACSLSVPTVLSGSNYQIHSPGRTWQLGLTLLYENEPIWLSLDIRS
jgi:CheY-specific phosphatase CheX